MSGFLPRRSHRREVLSVVERGWRGARECSLALDAMAIPVTHLIKGYLRANLRAMIRPYPHIRLVSVPRVVFRVWLWWALFWGTVSGRLGWLLVDQERTLRQVSWWCRVFRLTPVVVQETDKGYELRIAGKPMSFTTVFQYETRTLK